VLEQEHLPVYYAEPRFHTSVAWWLPSSDEASKIKGQVSQGEAGESAPGDAAAAPSVQLTDEQMSQLQREHGKVLRKPSLRVKQIRLKIGKEVSVFDLQ